MSGPGYGYHWSPCNRGGGGLAVAAAAVVGGILIWPKVIAAGHAAEHGTDVLMHDAWECIEWAAAILGIAAGLAITMGVLYLVSQAVTKRRQAIGTVPAAAAVTCTIRPGVPTAQQAPGIGNAAPLAIEATPALPLSVLAAFGHETAPSRRSRNQALIPKRGQHLTSRRLGNPELLMDGDDGRDHLAGG